MYKVVVIGGGWSGCAAAITAKKAGAEVVLIEKTDLLLGLGNVGGIMRNNGRYTATEENILLGAKELFEITDKYARHVGIEFPGHKHASLYDVIKVEPAVKRKLTEMGIELRMMARVLDVKMNQSVSDIKHKNGEVEKSIEAIIVAPSGYPSEDMKELEIIEGDVFVECTGSTGPMGNCLAYGNGCSMCVLRCPAFGPRVSISQKAGITDIMGMRSDGNYGAFSGSGKLEKSSLSDEIQKQLNKHGVVVVPIAEDDEDGFRKKKLDMKVCQQYALEEYADNVILLDTGYAKLMTPFYPLEKLRKIKGFENARYVDPYAGGKGNSVRYLSVTERDNSMKVKNIQNLFCGGEKSGLFVGHTEAITTGSLAGYNSARFAANKELLRLPRSLSVGDIIAFANESLNSEDGLKTRYTFAGAEYFQRMKEFDLYTTDKEEIRKRVEKTGLEGIYK